MADNPELQRLLAMSVDRTAYQNPLFQAVSQMAYAGLPTYARQGTQLSGTLSNQPPAAQAPGGGIGPGAAGILGGLGGAALNGLSGGGGPLKALIDGIKKLLSHNSANPYGKTSISNNYDPQFYDPNDPFAISGVLPGLPGEGTQWPGAPMPNVTTSEDYGLYGAGGIGDQGPYWPDEFTPYGGGGMGDQGPLDGTWHP